MANKRKLQTAGSETYYENLKNRFSNPEKIDFRQARANYFRQAGYDSTIDKGNTMSMEPDADKGARDIRNRPKNRKTKKTVNELLNLKRK